MNTEITSSSLQSLIDKRAKDRAWEFTRKLVEHCKQSGLSEIEGKYSNGEYNRDFADIFNLYSNQKNNPFTILYEKKYAQFIKEETESFVKKVEELHAQADNLLNISENFNY